MHCDCMLCASSGLRRQSPLSCAEHLTPGEVDHLLESGEESTTLLLHVAISQQVDGRTHSCCTCLYRNKLLSN